MQSVPMTVFAAPLSRYRSFNPRFNRADRRATLKIRNRRGESAAALHARILEVKGK